MRIEVLVLIPPAVVVLTSEWMMVKKQEKRETPRKRTRWFLSMVVVRMRDKEERSEFIERSDLRRRIGRIQHTIK